MHFLKKNILSADDMKTISSRIAEVEKGTIGEIRVSVVQSRSMKNRNLSVYDLAVQNFYELGMEKTKGKTGVLIYLLLSDRKFQIIGDEGINKKVSKEFWDVIAFKVAEYFRASKFVDGIVFAVDEVGTILKKEFPMTEGDTNELSNDVVVT